VVDDTCLYTTYYEETQECLAYSSCEYEEEVCDGCVTNEAPCLEFVP